MKNILIFVAVLFCWSGIAAEPKPGWFGFGITLHESSAPKPAKWLFVRAIDSDGPAAAAGLHVGDVIMAIDGKPVAFAKNADVLRFFGQAKPGTKLTLSVIRQQTQLTIKMKALPLPDKYAARRAGNRGYAERHDAQP